MSVRKHLLGQSTVERFGFRVDLKRQADFVSRADVLDLLQSVATLRLFEKARNIHNSVG